jgi:hypothetical protein
VVGGDARHIAADETIGRRAFLARCLNVGLHSEHPRPDLPVDAALETADDAIEILGSEALPAARPLTVQSLLSLPQLYPTFTPQ